MKTQSVAGVRGLLIVQAVSLVLMFLGVLMPRLLFALPYETMKYYWSAMGVVWFAFDIAIVITAVPFWRGQQNRASEPSAIGFLVLSVISCVLSGLQLQSQVGGPNLFSLAGLDHIVEFLLMRTVAVAAEICLWLALVPIASPPREWHGMFYGALGLNTVLGVSVMLLSFEERKEFNLTVLGQAMPWLRVVLSLVYGGLLIAVLRRLQQQNEAGTTNERSNAEPLLTSSGPNATTATTATTDLVVGGLLIVAGIAVTLGSYFGASSSGGGRYLIATGPLVYGAARLIRGLGRLGK